MTKHIFLYNREADPTVYYVGASADPIKKKESHQLTMKYEWFSLDISTSKRLIKAHLMSFKIQDEKSAWYKISEPDKVINYIEKNCKCVRLDEQDDSATNVENLKNKNKQLKGSLAQLTTMIQDLKLAVETNKKQLKKIVKDLDNVLKK